MTNDPQRTEHDRNRSIRFYVLLVVGGIIGIVVWNFWLGDWMIKHGWLP